MVDLDELERLEKAATPGPWEWSGLKRKEDYTYVPQGSYLGDTLITLGDTYEGSGQDCELLQAARNALPEIIAEVRELRAKVVEMERAGTFAEGWEAHLQAVRDAEAVESAAGGEGGK